MESENTPFSDNPPKLLDLVRDRLRAKHYSLRTGRAYVDGIKRFILVCDKRRPNVPGGFSRSLLREVDCQCNSFNPTTANVIAIMVLKIASGA